MLSRRLLPLACLSVLPAVACRSLPDPKGDEVQVLYEGALEEASPVDVVVAPVENRSGDPDVPGDLLRESFQRALVKRRYSPLALEFVEQAIEEVEVPSGDGEGVVTEASYRPGSLGEDAVLRVIVHEWDDSLLDTHGIVDARIDAYMLDGAGGPELWGGRVVKRVNLTQYRTRAATDRALLAFGCDEMAEEVLAAMPARTPRPGTR